MGKERERAIERERERWREDGTRKIAWVSRCPNTLVIICCVRVCACAPEQVNRHCPQANDHHLQVNNQQIKCLFNRQIIKT